MVLAYSSLYWISAIGLIAMTTISGGARVIAKEFQPEATWNYIEKYKVLYYSLCCPVHTITFISF